MLTLTEWRKKIQEMGGAVSTIVTKKDCHNPDFQVQGALCGQPKTKSNKPKKS